MPKRRFFGRSQEIHLIDERVSPLVLPPPPLDIPLEEDEIVYGEDLQEDIYEPLRVFIGSNVAPPNQHIEQAWSFEDDEEEISFDDISEEKVLQINLAQFQQEDDASEEPASSGALATLDRAFLVEEIDETFDEEESVDREETISLGVSTLSNAQLSDEMFLEDDIITEELFVPLVRMDDEEEHSVEHVLNQGAWIFDDKNSSSKGVASLANAELPLELDSVVLEGEIDFREHDLNETLESLRLKEKRLDAEINSGQWDSIFFVEQNMLRDFAVPALPIKKRGTPLKVFEPSDTKEEKTEVTPVVTPVKIKMRKKENTSLKFFLIFVPTFWIIVILILQFI